jgi:twitching motility protein PilT
MELHELLSRMVAEKASDLILKVDSFPSLRINGQIVFLDAERLTLQKCKEIYEILEDSKGDGFSNKREVDTAFDLPGIGRFRVNIFYQRGHVGFAFRHIESQILNFAELNLPVEQLVKLACEPRGLVLVTGVAGSGKSTTLAAIVQYINSTSCKHIVTIEDPIEFLHRDKKSIVNQREIGSDTENFLIALRHVVRQSPDVIMIGEMRDKETMEAALSAAETGHLVLSSLHTVDAIQTVERIINFFPPHQHNLIRLQLSLVLEGVVSQRLLPRKDGSGRVPAVEIMMATPTINELLLQGKTTELYRAIKDGGYFGCQTFNQSLKTLYQKDYISLTEALLAADNPEELKMELKGIMKSTHRGDFEFEY